MDCDDDDDDDDNDDDNGDDEDFLLPGSYKGFTCCGLYNRLLQDGVR